LQIRWLNPSDQLTTTSLLREMEKEEGEHSYMLLKLLLANKGYMGSPKIPRV
jgi:hypothetical protein